MRVDDIRTVAVIGAGTMGPGMAATFARFGYTTRLADIKPEMLEKARGTVELVYKTLIGGGFISDADAEAGRGHLTFTGDLKEAIGGADFVVEAIPEKLELKHAWVREVEGLVSPETILASNTSGLPITSIAEVATHPERIVGMHWSNPPHLIPVIEVIKGNRTSEDTVATTAALIRRIEMVPVLVQRDVPGFVENRILYAIMREALHLLESGVATAEDIDTVTKWGIGYKLSVIGPLELLDVAGLDIYNSVAGYLNADLSSASTVSATITEKVRQGHLGLKTGQGLFAYEPGEIPALAQRRARLLLAAKKALSTPV